VSDIPYPCMCGGCARCLHDQGYSCGDPLCWCVKGVNVALEAEPGTYDEDDLVD